jgi:Putative zinc-finger
MRCEDCLPVIEEYFDGEVEETTAARMGAHLAACATCAAALDALSFEQEIYARYDRGGLEVTPDLWSRVSAEIAREPLPESPAAPRPFLSRVREQLAAALGTLSARPALASSLALLIVGVAVGSLWLSRRSQPQPQPAASNEVARTASPVAPAAAPVVTPRVPDPVGSVAPDRRGSASLNDNAGGAVPAAYEPARRGSREGADRLRTVEIAPGYAVREDEIAALLATPSAPPPANTAGTLPEAHPVAADDTADLVANPSAVAAESVAVVARPLDPAQKEVARHVEQTQMLLRSFKNARASETGAVDVAYEQNLSRKLLAQNATLQLEAEVKGDKETKQVLDTIEPFLLDIANLRENPSRDEVRSIRERVLKNEIVAALQVY